MKKTLVFALVAALSYGSFVSAAEVVVEKAPSPKSSFVPSIKTEVSKEGSADVKNEVRPGLTYKITESAKLKFDFVFTHEFTNKNKMNSKLGTSELTFTDGKMLNVAGQDVAGFLQLQLASMEEANRDEKRLAYVLRAGPDTTFTSGNFSVNPGVLGFAYVPYASHNTNDNKPNKRFGVRPWTTVAYKIVGDKLAVALDLFYQYDRKHDKVNAHRLFVGPKLTSAPVANLALELGVNSDDAAVSSDSYEPFKKAHLTTYVNAAYSF